MCHQEASAKKQKVDSGSASGSAGSEGDGSKGSKDGSKGCKDGSKGGKGSGGKGGSKGKGGNVEFNGTCHHCGIWGHRQSDCKRLDAELAKKGGGKGAKGGPKGGKGPTLAQVGDENFDEGYAGEVDDSAVDDDWSFGGICSLSAAPAAPPALVFGPRHPPAPQQQQAARGRSDDTAAAAEAAAGRAKTQQRQQQQQQKQQQQPVHLQNRFAALSLLVDDAEPALLGAVSGAEVRSGRVVEAVIDSGAVHSVTPPSKFPGPMVSSPWSRAKRGYRAANGTGIKNLGQVQVAFKTTEGHKCQIPFQVAEVEQPLISVAHLAAAGNRVELGDSDGRIINLVTGKAIALEKRGGVYLLKMFIPDAGTAMPFGRQGA